jgi:nucleoid-associated protein YgaU
MQRIERYGVIALVFLLVTILAVAVWGQRKNQSLTSLFKRDPKPPANAAPLATAPAGQVPGRELSLSTPAPSTVGIGAPAEPAQGGNPALALAPPAGPSPRAITFDHGPSSAPGMSAGAPLTTPTPLGQSAPTQPTGGFVQPGLPQSSPVASSGAREYKVKRGETLGEIARRELGSSKRWTEISSLNGNLDPQRVREGMTLKLPQGGTSGIHEANMLASAPRPEPRTEPKVAASNGRTYEVRSGDSLTKIAASQLGDGDRWGEIAALNPSIDASRLKVGARLRLPAGSAPAKSAAAPRSASKSSDDDDVEVAKASSPKKGKVQ